MHNDEILKSREFSRRALMLAFGKAGLMGILASRLYYLQIIKSKEYKTLSDKNSIKISLTPAPRGHILDRFDNLLAVNKNNYRVLLDKEYAVNAEESINKLAAILLIDNEAVGKLINKVKKHNSYNSIILLDYLSFQEVIKIEVNAINLPGIFVEVGQIRHYDFGDLCAHIIGYVSAPSEIESKSHPLMRHPDMQIGKYGLEKTQDKLLTGKALVKRIEVDAHGHVIRELSREESVPGNNLKLTIDIKLQNFLSKQLSEQGAAAIVLDATNGEILAMNSSPSFDPNYFTTGISAYEWEKLLNNPYHPLINKVIAQSFSPGSSFKMVVGLAGLSGGVDPEFRVNCTGGITLGERKFHCMRSHGHVNLIDAITYSCNSYFYTIGQLVGIDRIADIALKLGFGKKSDIELQGELPGLIPTKKWKKQKYNQEWQMGDTYNSSIGQGYILTNLLQLAVMCGRIATGKQISPHLIAGTNNNFIQNIDINKSHLNIIRAGMENVVNKPGGTAYNNRIIGDNMKMAGKTGTAQVISKQHKEDLSAHTTQWHHRNHALFVSYAPIHNPKYVCAVIVEHGASGSGAAAPIARDILTEAQNS